MTRWCRSCPARPRAARPGRRPSAGQVEQINSTFSNGGPGCLWKTIEHTAHIRINDFLELTFAGFEKVINNLGGVSICLPEAVNDPMSGLHLKRGRHHVWGREALAFWRTREGLGEGSDLQRIQRDQFLMSSLVQGIEKKGLLTSTTKMASVVEIAAHNMFTSIQNVTQMLHLAETIRHVKAKRVQFIEVPTVTYTQNPNWVQWSTQAPQLFSAIARDTKLPKVHKGTGPVTKVKLAVATPASVSVEVLNGSGLQGQGAEALQRPDRAGLQRAGQQQRAELPVHELGHRVQLGQDAARSPGPQERPRQRRRPSGRPGSSRAR